MKHAYLIHGWDGTPEHGFFPWLKRELEARGYAVEVPFMPDADTPSYDKWVPYLETLIGTPDADTLLIGHSMGAQAALRYLERLAPGQNVGRVILVAPVVEAIMGMGAEEEVVARPWLERPLDVLKIRASAGSIVGIFSDNDRWIPLSSEQIVRERLGGQTVILPARGHFAGDDGCADLPELLDFV